MHQAIVAAACKASPLGSRGTPSTFPQATSVALQSLRVFTGLLVQSFPLGVAGHGLPLSQSTLQVDLRLRCPAHCRVARIGAYTAASCQASLMGRGARAAIQHYGCLDRYCTTLVACLGFQCAIARLVPRYGRLGVETLFSSGTNYRCRVRD